MTCIAVRGKTMACDSCWYSMGFIDVLAKKIHKLKSGALLGQAGDNDASIIVEMFEHAKPDHLPTRQILKECKIDFEGLLLYPNGRLFKISVCPFDPSNHAIENDEGVWEISGFPYCACGSGAELAIGALARGATARQAVEVAIKHDIHCRAPIHSMTVSESKVIPKKVLKKKH